MSSPLENRVVVMSGGSRGIGLAIAVALAREGARIALLAKTDRPHPKLPGTIHTAAEAIEAAGGEALPVVGDVRDEEQVEAFVAAAAERWGGVDVVVNNASAINLAPIADLPPKRYDLMLDINVRGTFLLTKAALPHLRNSPNGHVITLAPPLNLNSGQSPRFPGAMIAWGSSADLIARSVPYAEPHWRSTYGARVLPTPWWSFMTPPAPRIARTPASQISL